jgi:hypothetical protein
MVTSSATFRSHRVTSFACPTVTPECRPTRVNSFVTSVVYRPVRESALTVETGDHFPRRVTNGARTRDLLSAAIRCRPFQSVLVCPLIRLIYAVFGDPEEYFRPLITSYTNPVAVRLHYCEE